MPRRRLARIETGSAMAVLLDSGGGRPLRRHRPAFDWQSPRASRARCRSGWPAA